MIILFIIPPKTDEINKQKLHFKNHPNWVLSFLIRKVFFLSLSLQSSRVLCNQWRSLFLLVTKEREVGRGGLLIVRVLCSFPIKVRQQADWRKFNAHRIFFFLWLPLVLADTLLLGALSCVPWARTRVSWLGLDKGGGGCWGQGGWPVMLRVQTFLSTVIAVYGGLLTSHRQWYWHRPPVQSQSNFLKTKI